MRRRPADGATPLSLLQRTAALSLAWPLAKRDVMARYRGSVVGLAWALVAPLAMVLVYTLVFRGVFQARWGTGAGGDGFGYVARLFAGLMMFQGVAEVATRATRLMQDNANLVKRVVFPLELLAVALLLQVGVHALALQVAVLAAHCCWDFGDGHAGRGCCCRLPWHGCWCCSTRWRWLASVGAYLRDLQHAVPVAMTGLMFLSPVFYPTDAAPAPLRVLLLPSTRCPRPSNGARGMVRRRSRLGRRGLARAGALCVTLVCARWTFARLRPGFPDLV
jgi:lipopolysaccharide transport system permease protein